jgi:predicted ArsR family transcriptional regulator
MSTENIVKKRKILYILSKQVFSSFLTIFADNKEMNGLTASEMAEKLGLKLKTVKKRLETAGIKPLTKEAVYPDSALEAIRSVPGKGRPPKVKPEPPEK